MNVGKIIRFILVLGCIIGAIAYMASVSNKRELEKRVQNYQTENTMNSKAAAGKRE